MESRSGEGALHPMTARVTKCGNGSPAGVQGSVGNPRRKALFATVAPEQLLLDACSP